MMVIGTSAWYAAISTDPVAAKEVEDRMYRAGVEAGVVPLSTKKRSQPDPISSVEAAEVVGAGDAVVLTPEI